MDGGTRTLQDASRRARDTADDADLRRWFPEVAHRLERARVSRLQAQEALSSSGFDDRRRRVRTIAPLRLPQLHLDPLYLQNAEPLDPAWRAFAAESDHVRTVLAEARQALATLAEPEPAVEPVDDEDDPWVLAPVGSVNGAGLLTVARRLWLDDGAEPRLWVQTLQVAAQTEAVSGLPEGWPEETVAWILTSLADHELSLTRWRPIVRCVAAEEVPEGDLDGMAVPPGAAEDPDPIFTAVDHLEAVQRASQRADADRVLGALRVWRTAMQSVAGTPDAAINSPFQRSIQMQLAHTLRVSERTAISLVHTAESLATRCPTVWARFVRGDEPWRAMQIVHTALDGVREDVLEEFDEAAARELRRTALPVLKDALRRLRERLQVSTATERHRAAMEQRTVTLEPAADGMAYLTWFGPAPEAIALDHQLSKGAVAAHGLADENRSISQLRSDILMDLWIDTARRDASPHTDGVLVPRRRGVEPEVCVLIPAMTAMSHGQTPATLRGYGPIDIQTAKRLAGSAKSWVKVLTDPVTGAVLTVGRDRYRPTAEMRTLLGLLDGGGRGPGCPRPPSRCDADHVEPFRQGGARGRTALDNLVLLSRRHHVIKTSGHWDIRMVEGRTLIWRSFYGKVVITTVADPLEPTPVPEAFRADSGAPPPF